MIRAGSLDQRVTLERQSVTGRDGVNKPIVAWTALASVAASRVDVSDRERFAAGELAADRVSRFVVRWSSAIADFSPRDRLSYAGRAWQVLSVKEIGRRVGLEITATARADGGV